MQYFQHERGTYIGLYSFLLAGSNFFAPIIAGFIADAMGWQWVLVRCFTFFDTLALKLTVSSTGVLSSAASGSCFFSFLWKRPTILGTQ